MRAASALPSRIFADIAGRIAWPGTGTRDGRSGRATGARFRAKTSLHGRSLIFSRVRRDCLSAIAAATLASAALVLFTPNGAAAFEARRVTTGHPLDRVVAGANRLFALSGTEVRTFDGDGRDARALRGLRAAPAERAARSPRRAGRRGGAARGRAPRRRQHARGRGGAGGRGARTEAADARTTPIRCRDPAARSGDQRRRPTSSGSPRRQASFAATRTDASRPASTAATCCSSRRRAALVVAATDDLLFMRTPEIDDSNDRRRRRDIHRRRRADRAAPCAGARRRRCGHRRGRRRRPGDRRRRGDRANPRSPDRRGGGLRRRGARARGRRRLPLDARHGSGSDLGPAAGPGDRLRTLERSRGGSRPALGVWTSPDGATWTERTETLGRRVAGAATMGERIWLAIDSSLVALDPTSDEARTGPPVAGPFDAPAGSARPGSRQSRPATSSPPPSPGPRSPLCSAPREHPIAAAGS